ncbi:18338_t:CDS:10 [Acaulospora morrowiae]|uniref:18338_t:CDS:1 n=1 Tax=Acaulospora morrowiae TaxID=94023 RepID=A0A9N8WK14_9GLOM|nr:18338_t:CDS:10 [Acaulospora morrowiae]
MLEGPILKIFCLLACLSPTTVSARPPLSDMFGFGLEKYIPYIVISAIFVFVMIPTHEKFQEFRMIIFTALELFLGFLFAPTFFYMTEGLSGTTIILMIYGCSITALMIMLMLSDNCQRRPQQFSIKISISLVAIWLSFLPVLSYVMEGFGVTTIVTISTRCVLLVLILIVKLNSDHTDFDLRFQFPVLVVNLVVGCCFSCCQGTKAGTIISCVMGDLWFTLLAIYLVIEDGIFPIADKARPNVQDSTSGSNTAIIAVLTLLLGGTFYDRQIIATIFQIIWGIRLGFFCMYRMLKSNRDTRFDSIRSKFTSLLGFFVIQMIWVWTISLPLILLNSPRMSDPSSGGRDVHFGSATDIAGIVLFVFGLMIESIADIQKFIFRQNRTSPKQFMKTGLWSWSRHPNYFVVNSYGNDYFSSIFTILPIYDTTINCDPLFYLLRIGMFLLCLQPTISGVGTNLGYLSIASPILTILLLLFITGMIVNERPSHERQYKNGNWSEYSEYLNRTSCLILFPPSLYVLLPQSIKSTLFLEFPIYRYNPESGGNEGLNNDRYSSDGSFKVLWQPRKGDSFVNFFVNTESFIFALLFITSAVSTEKLVDLKAE